MKRKEEVVLIFCSVAGLGVAAYALLRKPSASTANQSSTTMAIDSGYNPTGGLSVANVGGSQADGGTLGGVNIANSNLGSTPIGIDPLTGNVINTIESSWENEDVIVDPSSWQGTTNSSGSPTYLNGELAGEGSSIAKLQGVTY